jgi:HNH endonuclease
MRELESVKQLSDQALVLKLVQSVQEDRCTTVRLLVHMGEVEARGLYRDQGFPSMFHYAVRKLHMSEAEAALRMRVAKLGREFPVALEMLGRGELHLTALNLLAPVLNHSTLGLLQLARFQSKQKVLELRAQYAPRPDAPASIRRLPERKQTGSAAFASASTGSAEAAVTTTCASAVPDNSSRAASSASPTPDATTGTLAPLTGAVQPSTASSPNAPASRGPVSGPRQTETERVGSIADSPSRDSRAGSAMPDVGDLGFRSPASAASGVPTPFVAPDPAPNPPDTRSGPVAPTPAKPATFGLSMPSPASAVIPLSPARFKVTFTASQRVRDKLEEAQDLLRHQLPSRDLEHLFERALDALIAEHKKRRFAQTDKPRRASSPARSKPNSRIPSNEVRRRVWARDGGRCCFKGPDGTRCSARSLLEFHHIVPFPRGGPTTVENLALMCKTHNALLAERDYGREYIRARVSAARRVRTSPATEPTQRDESDVPAGHPPGHAGAETRPARLDEREAPARHPRVRTASETERAQPPEREAQGCHRRVQTISETGRAQPPEREAPAHHRRVWTASDTERSQLHECDVGHCAVRTASETERAQPTSATLPTAHRRLPLRNSSPAERRSAPDGEHAPRSIQAITGGCSSSCSPQVPSDAAQQ